jgi:flagellar basal body P-ring formation protein FlgA
MKPLLPLFALLAAAAPKPPQPAPAATRPAVPAALITFRDRAEVRDRVIRLRDVAAVEGDDAALVAALEAVDVGAAPLTGHTRTVSGEYARIRIRQIGVDTKRLEFAGAKLITVTRPDQVLPGAAVEKVACDAVEAANPGVAARATFTPADVRLPLGTVELKPQEARLAGTTTATVPVQVFVDGRSEATVTVSFRLLRRAPALVAAHDLLPGALLAADDVRVEDRPVVPGPLLLAETSQAVGQQVAVPIKAGSALTASMVKPAVLVKRGARVKLICRGPNFTATTGGEALQNGTLGSVVRVRNLTSLLEVTGLVTGAQTVEVPF